MTWLIESAKRQKWSCRGWGWFLIKPGSFSVRHCIAQELYKQKKKRKCRVDACRSQNHVQWIVISDLTWFDWSTSPQWQASNSKGGANEQMFSKSESDVCITFFLHLWNIWDPFLQSWWLICNAGVCRTSTSYYNGLDILQMSFPMPPS